MPVWLTVNVWPPMAMVPLLELLLELLPTLYETVPFPLPLDPPVTVIHDRLDEALHEQPAPEVTLKEPVPPLAPCDREPGEIE